MTDMSYIMRMSLLDKPLVWLHSVVSSPPFSKESRIEAGYLLRLLQKGIKLSLPQSRPMPNIGKGCHELRINDKNLIWRIVYLIEPDAIVILDVFEKKTPATPKNIIATCKHRMQEYRGAGK
jgi:phage-related protein